MITLEQIDIAEQLTNIYFREEWWQSHSMPYEEAIKYHTKLYNQGNIVVYQEDDKVIGYLEVWRINFEQFGKLVCHEHFSAYHEEINRGNIAYVANTWIQPDKRGGYVYKSLRNLFFRNNFMCNYYVGQALRKKTQPIKVFKKSDLSSKLFKTGV